MTASLDIPTGYSHPALTELRAYLAEVTTALGIGLESCTVDHDAPVSAYVALDEHLPGSPAMISRCCGTKSTAGPPRSRPRRPSSPSATSAASPSSRHPGKSPSSSPPCVTPTTTGTAPRHTAARPPAWTISTPFSAGGNSTPDAMAVRWASPVRADARKEDATSPVIAFSEMARLSTCRTAFAQGRLGRCPGPTVERSVAAQ